MASRPFCSASRVPAASGVTSSATSRGTGGTAMASAKLRRFNRRGQQLISICCVRASRDIPFLFGWPSSRLPYLRVLRRRTPKLSSIHVGFCIEEGADHRRPDGRFPFARLGNRRRVEAQRFTPARSHLNLGGAPTAGSQHRQGGCARHRGIGLRRGTQGSHHLRAGPGSESIGKSGVVELVESGGSAVRSSDPVPSRNPRC